MGLANAGQILLSDSYLNIQSHSDNSFHRDIFELYSFLLLTLLLKAKYQCIWPTHCQIKSFPCRLEIYQGLPSQPALMESFWYPETPLFIEVCYCTIVLACSQFTSVRFSFETHFGIQGMNILIKYVWDI